MWKLEITQKRQSKDSNYVFDEKIEFKSENLYDLCSLLVKLTECDCECDKETAYKISRVNEGEE